LQRLGRVLHLSSSRSLILKAEALPRIGAKVLDDSLKSIGTVFDIIGPVSSPYVVIKPGINTEPLGLINKVVYTIPSGGRRKEKRKYGR